jgi:NHL repeat
MTHKVKNLLVLVGVFIAALAAATPALASRPHEYTGTFGKPCTPCAGGELTKPAGIAVNEATGDVYVVDEGANRVVVFDKAGNYVSELNGSGSLAGEGYAAGKRNPGEVETGRFEKPQTLAGVPPMIAVDNSCVLEKLPEPECKVKDPSAGDVYIVDAGHRVVDKYAPTGPSGEDLEYVGQITAGAAGRFAEGLDGVAVGAKGSVWVYQEEPSVSSYTNATPNVFISATTMNGLRGFGKAGFAVDGAGDFYLRLNAHELQIAKETPTAEVLNENVGGKEASAVAVEQGSNDALIDNLTSVGVVNAAGEPVERLGEEGGIKHLSEGTGIAVNESAETVYVADALAGQVVVFGPKRPAAPVVEPGSESIGEVTSVEATLSAKIDPQSEPGEAPTKYRFEYGRCVVASDCAASGWEEVAGSGGQLVADFNVHAVSAKLSGLAPHATYHFRAVAENEQGKGLRGEEFTFTTEGVGGELVLPDDRGWELVSPPDKLGSRLETISEAGVVEASASGDAITYLANAPTESQPAGYSNDVQVLSSRGSSSWSSRDIALSHPGATGFSVGEGGTEYKFFNPELTLAAVQPFGQFNPQLSAAADESTAYLHDLTVTAEACTAGSSCYVPLVTRANDTSSSFQPFGEAAECQPKVAGNGSAKLFCGPQFLGASEDLGHVVLGAKAELVAGAGVEQLYEWGGGELAPVSVLPHGEAVPTASQPNLGDGGDARGAISSDGSLVDWTVPSGPDQGLYLRDVPRGETIQLDQAQAGSGGTSGGGEFQLAAADGRRVLFTDTHKLTANSGAETRQEHADLYECKIVLSPAPSCELHDLTPAHGAEEEGAQVQGSILGASADGAYVYLVAEGVQSEVANARGQKAESGKPNLYVWHEGSMSFIATLSSGDETDWLNGDPLFHQPTRVSENGRYLEFMSQGSPTGYDNADAKTGKPVAEVYLYDAMQGRLACASCLASGERPVGVEYEKLQPGNGGLVGGPRDIWPHAALVAANVPGWTVAERSPQKTLYQPRYLNDEGRLFFNSADALVPQDSNGTEDVYEYEPPGIKGPEGNELCTEAMETFNSSAAGCVSLISSGSSSQESAFLDASESGNDVFFLTSARLSKIDEDSSRDVYDAHVCTGASPCIAYPTVQSPPCTTEASCKAAPSPQPSIFGAPPSATFQGLGNPAPVAAVKAKAKPLTRAQKLSAALKVCKRDKKKAKRQACEKQARKKYGPLKKAKAKGKKKGK